MKKRKFQHLLFTCHYMCCQYLHQGFSTIYAFTKMFTEEMLSQTSSIPVRFCWKPDNILGSLTHCSIHWLQLKQSLAITHNFTWTNKVLRNYTKKLTLAKHVKLVITFHTECFPHSSSLAWRHNRQYVSTLQSPLKSRHIDGSKGTLSK